MYINIKTDILSHPENIGSFFRKEQKKSIFFKKTCLIFDNLVNISNAVKDIVYIITVFIHNNLWKNRTLNIGNRFLIS